MPLADPKEVRAKFWASLEKLQHATEPMQPDEQRRLASSLGEVYNYVAAQVDKRGNMVNAIWSQSAHDARVKEILESEQRNLASHKQFVEANFDNADKYLKTIQLAGYAAFFATWGFTRQWLNPLAEAWAALLMITSALFFVIWEIGKASVLVALLRKHAQISMSGLDDFILMRSSSFSRTASAISWFARARIWVWYLCIIPASIAIFLMVGNVVFHIVRLIR